MSALRLTICAMGIPRLRIFPKMAVAAKGRMVLSIAEPYNVTNPTAGLRCRLTTAEHFADRPRFLPAGDSALVVEFADRVDPEVSARVLALARRIAGAAIAGVVETVPTFRSLMVHYDPLGISNQELRARLEPLLRDLAGQVPAGRHWHLPACYDPSLGVDLAEVAERTGLSAADVV